MINLGETKKFRVENVHVKVYHFLVLEIMNIHQQMKIMLAIIQQLATVI